MAVLTYGDLRNAPAGAFLLDIDGEHYSATRGDYWEYSDEEEVRDCDGEPLLLVVERTQYIVLAGEDAA